MNFLNVLATRKIRFSLGVLIGIAVGAEMLFLFQSTAMLSSSKDVLLARDDDAALFLEVTRNTTWTNQVKAPYGPFYYRVSASLEKLVPNSVVVQTNEPPTERDVYKRYHFAMMLVSVLALIAVAGLIASHATRGWPERLAVFGGLIGVFFRYSVWASHIFRGHPELLLTCLVTVATLFSLKINLWESRLKSRSFYLCAIFGGLACTTKQSAGAFVIGFSLVLLLPFSKRFRRLNPYRLVELPIFLGVTSVTYLLAGYPSTANMVSNISGATHFVAQKSQSYSWQWTFNWLSKLGEHLLLPVLLVFFSALIFGTVRATEELPKEKDQPNFTPILGSTWWAIVIPLVPLGFILTSQVVIPTAHYMLTIIGSLLIFQTFIQRRYIEELRRRTIAFLSTIQKGRWLVPHLTRSLAVVLIAVAILSAGGRAPAAVWAVTKQSGCISDVNEVIAAIIHNRKQAPGILASTPYFPCPFGQRCRHIWAMTDQKINRIKPLYLGFSHRYVRRFLGNVKAYDKHNFPNWQKVKAFHARFDNQQRIKDSAGTSWALVLKTKVCAYELWKRLPKSP